MSLLSHFGLAAQPFGVTPDPRFMYHSVTHREALACLLHGIASDRGFTALIAEPGMGKTTLLFHLLQMLKGKAKTAFLFQTICGPQEFLATLLADLGIDDQGGSISTMQSRLNEYLLQQGIEGRQVVVIIDEAQNLDEQVLEIIRMLSNFETGSRKLMHVVLAGQPQLAKKLGAPNLAQLRQRISIVARLDRFGANETRDYIEHRLRVAGRPSTRGPLFTKRAYAIIEERSEGIPRNVNNLCFNAMSLACALKTQVVDEAMVHETVRDLELATIAAPPVSIQKDSRDESQTRSPFSLLAFSPAVWARRVLFGVALVSLVCLGFVFGRALGERTADTFLKYPADVPKPVALTMPTPMQPSAANVSTTFDPKDVSQGQQSGKRFEAAGVASGSGANRRSRKNRSQRSAALRKLPVAVWSAKFSSPLQPPHLTHFSRTESDSEKLQLPAEEVSVPLPLSTQGGKP